MQEFEAKGGEIGPKLVLLLGPELLFTVIFFLILMFNS